MSVLKKIKEGAEDLAKLQITTVVGPIEFVNDKPVPGNDVKVMYSEVDLIDGDIKSYFDPAFMEAPLNTIRQFHQAKEDDGRAIIARNVEVLKDLAQLILDFGGDEGGDETPAPGDPDA